MIKKTLGGDRLGAGKKMEVELHNYERSTHDLGYLWRSTMSAGTLVPFMKMLAIPGDTFDIDLWAEGLTHPTVGPLFGSFKMQLDIFEAPIRLYQGRLHMNELGIGMNMAGVKLPVMRLVAEPLDSTIEDKDNAQVNPSCILSYLGIRGIGTIDADEPAPVTRDFNAVPWLAYWEIYKNYYANKQEEEGAVIHNEPETVVNTVDLITLDANAIPPAPAFVNWYTAPGSEIIVTYTGTPPIPEQIMIRTGTQGWVALSELILSIDDDGSQLTITFDFARWGAISLQSWRYIENSDIVQKPPTVVRFPLSDIDEMRKLILHHATENDEFVTTTQTLEPYSFIGAMELGTIARKSTQEGLAIKTYQSDLFNNWLNQEWIDGTNGIAEITAVDTSGGNFKIDALILARKVYDMLNRVAVSGGTYNDWLEAVYAHEPFTRAESPIYHGSLIREMVFQEVVSNSEAAAGGSGGSQPLGTLAGRGVMSNKSKGGKVTIKVNEPGYIIGIVSLTPRLDYSQGNDWDTHLLTMDDLFKPGLDQIGYQELITEQMAWWTTFKGLGDPTFVTKSAGKQPAWTNYMTATNKALGNFAISTNEMFMTLNRRYEWAQFQNGIEDLTTYIDPVKFNHIFAQTSIDAQNFWVQIAVDCTARRKMSGKLMPNL